MWVEKTSATGDPKGQSKTAPAVRGPKLEVTNQSVVVQ